ncbi:hypothetical protein H5410_020881, partial [Solanum commersonii]
SNFTAEDFCFQVIVKIENFLKTQRVPIIIGGSNSYIEKLMEDPVFKFKYKYDTCFIWIDVEHSVLNRRVDRRVDQMVNAGTEKSRLSIDLATHFRGEIINSDKMQVYKGLDIVTNKITHTEKKGVRYYFFGEIEQDSDSTVEEFYLQAIVYIEIFLISQRVQIIVGGSNSYIENHVEDPVFMFKFKRYTCFIWIDVEQSILIRRVDMRVDQMVDEGLVDELRQILIQDVDYTKGIRRSIGVP